MQDALFNFCNFMIVWSKTKGETAATQACIDLARDLMEFIFPGDAYGACTWGTLSEQYRKAWVGEIIRRFKAAGGATTVVQAQKEFGGPIKELISAIKECAIDGESVNAVYFSQFCINHHFQGNYVGQPQWLADKDIVACAKLLRADPTLSKTMRIGLYHQGNLWMTMNNRGLALHSLASVTPLRFVFKTDLSSEETERLHDTFERYSLNFAESLPASRRRATEWEAVIPTSVVASTVESPFRKVTTKEGSSLVAKRVDVIYTVKSMINGVDNGNETVINAL